MPIPTSQIPNAPSTGAPSLMRSGGGVPTRRPVDVSGAGFDGSSLGRAQSLLANAGNSVQRSVANVARATANNQQDLIDARGFVAEGEAWQGVGAAIERASSFAQQVAEGAMIAKDAADFARVNTILSDARAQHAAWTEREGAYTPQDWLPKWNEIQPKVMERIGELGVSGRIKARVEEASAIFFAEHAANLMPKAYRQSTNLARAEVSNSITTAVDDGDFDLAAQLGEEAVASGLFSKPEWDAKVVEIEARQNQNALDTAIAADPKNVADHLSEAIRSGKSEFFPWMDGKPAEMVRAHRQAESLANDRLAESFEAGMDAIAAGEWTTPEQVKQFGEMNDWPQSRIEAAESFLTKTWSTSPAGIAEQETYIAGVRSAISAYDPQNDPKKDRLFEIEKMLANVPEGRRQYLREELNTRKADGTFKPSSEVESAAFSQVNTMLSDGYFGTWTSGKGDKKKTDTEAKLQAAQTANRMMDAFKEWHRDNPKATRAEGIEWIRKQTAADRQTKKATQQPRGKGLDWLPRLMLPGFRTQSQPTDDTDMGILKKGQTMQDKQKETAAQAPDFRDPQDSKKIPASIRYNNPGAMYPGPSSEKFGAVETKTIGGGHKIAVFPDAISGAAALFDLYERKYTGKTLASAIKTWSGGNSVTTYLKTIQREAGVSADTVITKDLMRDPKFAVALAKAMSVQEAGREYPLNDDQWLAAHRKAFAV